MKKIENLRLEVKIEDEFNLYASEINQIFEDFASNGKNLNALYETIVHSFYLGHQRGQAQKRQELNNLALKGVM